MPVTQTLPRVANSAILLALDHERATQNFHVDLNVARLSLEYDKSSYVSHPTVKGMELTLNDKKAIDVSNHMSGVKSLALADEKALNVSEYTTEVTDLALDSEEPLNVTEGTTEVTSLALDSEKALNVTEGIKDVTGLASDNEKPLNVTEDTTEATSLALDSETALSATEAATDVTGLAPADEKALNVAENRTEVTSLALDDERALNVAENTTEVTSLALDDVKALSVSHLSIEEMKPTLEDKKTPNVLQATSEEIFRVVDEDRTSAAFRGATEVSNTSGKILDIIFDYALNKFDDSKGRLAAGIPKFLSDIKPFVEEGKQLQMCLPAFPFKSANKVYKVLGTLPDKAEEIALDRLNSMCARIGDIYGPGAKLTIISDGLVYNDLLSISDRDTWAYGEALRAMAQRNHFIHIAFSRLGDLVNFPMPENLQEITYVANATNFRRCLLNTYGRDKIDIDKEISTSPDTLMTYRGYRRFLESDLQHIFPTGNGRSSKGYKRDVKYLAKQMLIRGYAFAEAVKVNFPNHLRLSIHQSTGEHKVSMSLLNTKTGYTTPWHCSIALMADGEWLSAPMGDFKEDPMLEVVYEDGRPSYFQERIRKRPYLTHTETFVNNK